MTFLISSDGFSQAQVRAINTITSSETLDFLSGVSFADVEPDAASSAFKDELTRLSSTSGIANEEIVVKTHLIELVMEPITNFEATPEVAFSNAYPALLQHIEDNNLSVDNVDEMVLDIALLLE